MAKNSLTTLTADAGSTKTHWLLRDGEANILIKTQGINPAIQTDEYIAEVIGNELIRQGLGDWVAHHSAIDEICFYGAGCNAANIGRMQTLIGRMFSDKGIETGRISVNSDMLGAAISVCGVSAGIVCILGTGSNSCLYDGQKVEANTPPLGYILGDEGSGASIGRHLLNALYKHALPATLLRTFEEETSLTMEMVLQKVYRQPLANRFLASLSPFVARHIDEYEELAAMIDAEFQRFVERNILPYGHKELPVGAVGSVAWHYRERLKRALKKSGYQLATVKQSPLSADHIRHEQAMP